MGTITKRGKKYFAQVCVDGIRKSKSHPTKREAKTWVLQAESGLIGLNSENVTINDLVEKYIAEVVPGHKGAKQEKLRLRRLATELPPKPMEKITSADISDWKTQKLKKVQSPTVRRYMTTLNSMFNYALNEWKLINHNPLKGVKKPPSNPARIRIPDKDEIEFILAALGYDENKPVETHKQRIAVSFLVAIETAMRAGEIRSLSRDNVDYKRSVASLINTKNKDSREVPLSRRAIELLKKVDPEYFPMTGEVHSTLFRGAVRDAGIDNLRFHDSRAAGLTRLSKILDILPLSRMVGIRDPRTLMVYYRESADDIVKLLD